MKAKDIMTTRVFSVKPDTRIQEIARLLMERQISAAPVVDENSKLVGIVSEGDLLRREDIGTGRARHSWWLRLFEDPETLTKDYTRTHGRFAKDVMTSDVVSVDEETSVADIAEILESKHIKRVPVTRDGKLVGIVSRANIIQRIAASRAAQIIPVNPDDGAIREEIERTLREQPWSSVGTTSITVTDGVVELWGTISSETERDASRVAIENIAGIERIDDRRAVRPLVVGDGL